MEAEVTIGGVNPRHYRRRLFAVLALCACTLNIASCKRHSTRNTAHNAERTPASSPAAAAPPGAGAPKRTGSPSKELNPFERYLADAKNNWPEPSLVRFASSCGVDADTSAVRYAQQPGERWIEVKDLSGAMQDQETDFYHTLAIWHSGERALAEEWGMELDTGDYYRMFFCLNGDTITSAESVSWALPEDEDRGASAWGYDTVWALGADGNFALKSKRFVDLCEQPITEPALEPDVKKSLAAVSISVRKWADLKYPAAMLR